MKVGMAEFIKEWADWIPMVLYQDLEKLACRWEKDPIKQI